MVTGKVVGNAPGATVADVAWLKLQAVTGGGQFAAATTIQRLNTKGGASSASCGTSGELTAAPYAADYVFLSKPQSSK